MEEQQSSPLKRPRLEPKPEPLDAELIADDSSAIAVEQDLPDDFLEPLDETSLPAFMPQAPPPAAPSQLRAAASAEPIHHGCRQFWKAGDYEGNGVSAPISVAGGIDHVRVHPKFLHSNATSHKWALGAIAELLDNSLDEVHNGATFVEVDMIQSPQDGGPMLLVEDDGGGMNPDNIRACMSLGYSAKSKRANTIGQYGNGFKTSTMRLGSDVIVFSRHPGEGDSPTQSVGMLSYSFLRDTGQEDIIVPMIDYEVKPFGLKKLVRSTVDDWNCNLDTLVKWSPYRSEAELLQQFTGMKNQGTKIVLYNLWEDDQGQLELDFESDPYDIQVRGANRDEQKILMAKRFPNSRHYLTYRHSLRSYASILYLRLAPGFKMTLRGREVEYHNLVNDLMFTQEQTYKPQGGSENFQREKQMLAVVTIGFVKDAKDHIDVQGFNVYHKNRLIKPFWRIWNSASSQGRGIIGVLEANFVEPAHDKQGFERTVVLARLESRLLQMQKTYWNNNCHRVGYFSAKKKDMPRFSYPAKGFQAEAGYKNRVLTRRGDGPEKNSPAFAKSSFEPSGTSFTFQDVVSSDLVLFEERDVSSRQIATDQAIGTVTLNQQLEKESLSFISRHDVDAEIFLREVAKNKELEAKVLDLERKVGEMRNSMDILTEERDKLRSQLESEFRQRALDDEGLRLRLKPNCTHVSIKFEHGLMRFFSIESLGNRFLDNSAL
ncbi:hypothetical protein GOP47_0007722 [Adiantum capillus-veneris]|uniref:Morc S5 domain-containing protein n=1 Tax=Adiantum capillus-veneris TaxID=13818 RepID=A0A9D4V248_ADICA|nr:hypothetical protein GOP47_0007722 [Adiantum capillus-veneris]